MPNSELVTRDQAAAYLGVQAHTLAAWASTRRYPLRFIKVGRLVRYRKSDLDDFLARRTVGGPPAKKARRLLRRLRPRSPRQSEAGSVADPAQAPAVLAPAGPAPAPAAQAPTPPLLW